MKCFLAGALLYPAIAISDPSCEEIYWGEVYDQQLGTEYGLLPLQGTADKGSIVAARGADQENSEALEICPKTYTIVEMPRLMFSTGNDLADIPGDWGKNSESFDTVVVYDPDGVGSASVSVFWDAGEVLVPIRTTLFDSASGIPGDPTVMNFDELITLFPNGDGLLFVHDLSGPVLLTHYLRWDAH